MSDKPKGGMAAIFGAGWFWFSQITSIIGLVGIIDDLKVWGEIARWCAARLNEALPQAAAFLAAAGAAIHAALAFFHGLYRPLFELLFSWLPFQVPVLVSDILLVVIFVLLGRWRIGGAFLKEWVKVTQQEHDKLLQDARAEGIEVSEKDSRRLEWALRGYLQEKAFGIVPTYAAADMAWARASYGEAFERLGAKQPNLMTVDPTKSRLLTGEGRAKLLIYFLAGVTAALLAVEYFFFR